MTDPDVPHDDMLSFLWRSRMDIPQMGDEALDALLAQNRGPGDTTAPLRPVEDVLAALRAAPSHGELTVLDPVLAEFRWVSGMQDGFHRSRPRRPALLRTLLSVKITGVAAAAVLGGSVAAAYAGVLPAALQKIAHNSIAAPAGALGARSPAIEGWRPCRWCGRRPAPGGDEQDRGVSRVAPRVHAQADAVDLDDRWPSVR